MTLVTRIVLAGLILIGVGLSIVIIPPLFLVSSVVVPLAWGVRRIAWVSAQPGGPYRSAGRRGTPSVTRPVLLRPRLPNGGQT